MAEIPGNISKMLIEESDYESPVSENILQKLGANINFFIDNIGFQNSTTMTASGDFNVPEGTTQALLIVHGGGGGGGGNGTGVVGDGQGGQGGSTIWADPTNGTLTFKGGHGGGAPGLSGTTLARPVYQAGAGGFSNGGSFGGTGGDGDVHYAGNGGDYFQYTGGAGGAWGVNNRPGGGGGAGPSGDGAAGALGSGTNVGASAAASTGAGGGGASSNNGHGAGGGAGAPLYVMLVNITALDIIPVTIGAGGTGGFPSGGSGAVSGGAGGSGKLTVWY